MEDRRNFDISLDLGEQGEEWSKQLIVGEGNTTFEVKTDLQAYDTGNFFIEVESWDKDGGILVTTADWWILNIVKVFHEDGASREQRARDYRDYKLNTEDIKFSVLIRVDYLKDIVKKHQLVSGGDNNKALGYLLPIGDLCNGGVPLSRRI